MRQTYRQDPEDHFGGFSSYFYHVNRQNNSVLNNKINLTCTMMPLNKQSYLQSVRKLCTYMHTKMSRIIFTVSLQCLPVRGWGGRGTSRSILQSTEERRPLLSFRSVVMSVLGLLQSSLGFISCISNTISKQVMRLIPNS